MPANRPSPLVSAESLGDSYFVLTFRHPEIAHEARPGQFAMIKAGLSPDPPLRRPFSILATRPEDDAFSVFIKAIGQGTHALSRLATGDPAQVLGPLGRPFPPPPAGATAAMVAGGYGIAPFFLFASELLREGRPARVFYGGRRRVDVKMHDRFDGVCPLIVATEDGSLGEKGRVTLPLRAFLDEARTPVVLYSCGPEGLLHAVAGLAEERGLPAFVSLDPWMGCGIGTCLGCVVKIQGEDEARAKNRCACTEGPVFDAATVVWPGEAVSSARRAKVPA